LSEGDENDGSFYGSIPRSKPCQAEETDDSSNTGVNPVASSAQGDTEQQTPHGNAPLPSAGSSGTRQWRNLTEPPSPGGRSKGTGGALSPSTRRSPIESEDPQPFDHRQDHASGSSDELSDDVGDSDAAAGGMRRSISEPNVRGLVTDADGRGDGGGRETRMPAVGPSFSGRDVVVRKPSMLADKARKKEFAKSRWAKANWWGERGEVRARGRGRSEGGRGERESRWERACMRMSRSAGGFALVRFGSGGVETRGRVVDICWSHA
jgi:hypothetical protein